VPDEPLTARELQVVRAFLETGSQKAAAAKLGLSWMTVRAHLASARAKRGVTKSWQLRDAA
jgi:DNA-binding CsgD family transcriptional regulator